MSEPIDFDLDSPAFQELRLRFFPITYEDHQEVISKENGYAINCNNQRMSVFLCIQAGYLGYECFNGTIKKSGRSVNLRGSSTSGFIQTLFNQPPVEHWRDDTIETMEFFNNGIHFEFSWSIYEKNVLNYLIVEEQKK